MVEVCPPAFRLRAEKGVNLPNSDFPTSLSALTSEDLENLAFIMPLAARAKRHLTVGLSFVRNENDVVALQRTLRDAGASSESVGICVKIETQAALACLPLVLLAALAGPPASVMLARGDLAAEVGFGSLAGAMDDVVTLAAAAHLPVVFATQVLETLSKTGTPSRSEVSDVAVASRCECVMLNKGAHVADSVRFLARALERNLHRTHKHRLMLRTLSSIDLARFLK